MAFDLEKLKSNIESRNLAADMDELDLNRIGRNCIAGYDRDIESNREWREKAETGLDIARQIAGKKTYPWPGASNVKYPLIATAAIQFAARAYPQIIQGADVVKAKIIGKVTEEKETRAKRVGAHMSYQLTEQMEEWEEDTDQLLTSLPVVGMYFRKTYFDPLWGRNMSVALSPLDLVIHAKSKSLKTTRRTSEKVMLHRNDVLERQNSGMFVDKSIDVMETADEEDKPELFIEQHTWIDLDDDGYQEPYIVTIHKESEKVCRIVARYDEDGIKINSQGKIVRIEAVHYYTDFGFLPDPAGNYYKLGFAHLLGPINESISTTINQLLDAGHLANVQGGLLGNGIRLQGGVLRITPGVFTPVETMGGALRDNVFPFPFKEPSMVLFQLLGLLTETGMKLAAVSETMTGEMPGQNTPATTVLAMIEQGLKVFTSIYKRVFRSLKSEYKKLYRLNRLYMDETEYINVLDDELAVFQKDYDTKDLDIVPVADPTVSSEAQRLARAQAILNAIQFNPTAGGKVESLRYYYDAITGMPELTKKFLPQQELDAPPAPDPKMIEMQIKGLESKVRMTIDQQRANIEQVKAEAEIEAIYAKAEQMMALAMKAIADAEAVEVGQQFEQYRVQLDSLGHDLEAWKANTDAKLAAVKPGAAGGEQDGGITGTNVGGGVPGMEAAPDNGEGPPTTDQIAGGLPAATPPGGDLEQRLSGDDGAANLASVGSDLRNISNSRLAGSGQ
jgi:chaperonin GroES